MATINILPRKKFEIILEDGSVIPGQYGTWAGIRFSQKRGIKLSQTADALNQAVLDENFEVVGDYVLAAIEQPYRETGGKDFKYTFVDFCKWMDELGWDKLGQVLNPEIETEQKKSPDQELPSNGTISSELQEAAA